MPVTAEERRAKRRAYYARNRERIAAYLRQNNTRLSASRRSYYQRNKTELYKKQRAYLAANPEKVRLWKRVDYERHREAYIRRATRNGRSEKAKLQRAIYYRANKDRIAARHRAYQQRNQSKLAQYQRLYRLSAKGRASKKASDRRCATRVAAYKAEWARRNRKRLNERFRVYVRERVNQDPAFAIRMRLRSRLVAAIHGHLNGRPQSVTRAIRNLLGCSLSELICYLESKFLPGMSWDNRNQWHIDPIKPLCAFDLTDPEQQALAFHYTNLQPLWALDNMRKGRRWEQ